MKNFNEFISENLTDKMVPKSKEEIDNKINQMTPDELLKAALYEVHDIGLVQKAIDNGVKIDKDYLLYNIFILDHYNENMLDFINNDITTPGWTDDWFIGHCLDRSVDEQKKIMEFFKEATILLINSNQKLKEELTAFEIIAIQQILDIE